MGREGREGGGWFNIGLERARAAPAAPQSDGGERCPKLKESCSSGTPERVPSETGTLVRRDETACVCEGAGGVEEGMMGKETRKKGDEGT